MIRKTVVALLAAIIVLCFVMPAAAETFIPEDGVISIDLPNENWKKIEDVTKWLTFSDGANQITIEHFSNGEKLPPISVADSHYVNVFQAAFSTQNEVFVVTGSVVDAAKIPEVTQAIMSLKVLKYDTKRAVSSQPQTGTSEFTVVPMDKTMYVTADSLNVRKGCSTDTQLLGGYKKGSQVKVTGSVQRNGVDLGWYQVNSSQIQHRLQLAAIPAVTPPYIPEMCIPFMMKKEILIRCIRPRTVSGATAAEQPTASSQRRNSRPGKAPSVCPFTITVRIIMIIPIRKAKGICSTAGTAVSGLKQVMSSTTTTARDDKRG